MKQLFRQTARRAAPLAFLLAFPIALATGAAASGGQAPKAVVELFTSQGCSSCPPADARLAELSRDPDIVALTLHVDYWDYLGWKDTLAEPAFSERQRAYAAVRGERGVFTPQMVVNGRVACIGSKDDKIAQAFEDATSEHPRLPVPLRVAREGGEIVVRIDAGVDGAGELLLLTVKPSVTVEIERGENKGREATYVNVVRDIVPIGRWEGGAARFSAPAGAQGEGFVVLLHADDPQGPGAIIGAAKAGL